MDWFYAEKDIRKGPISESELAGLISARKVGRDTLVWNRTMTDWQPAGLTALFAASAQTPPPSATPTGHHLCIVTGKNFPESQMLKTEHGWVSVEGKDLYFQSIREGVPIPLADGQSNARADGNKIVVPVTGGKLPMRCVKTNQLVSEDGLKTKTLYWCHPAIFFALLVNLLVVIILYYVLRKKVTLTIPVSREGRRLVARATLIAWAIFFGGLALFISGLVAVSQNDGGPFAVMILLGLLVLLFGIAYGGRKAPLLRVAKIKNGHAWLVGAHREFVASLPPYL